MSAIWARAAVFTMVSATAQAQNCPPVDLAEQKARELQCHTAGGEWARFGAYAHLCGIYSCAMRTKDGGKPCRNHTECEFLCTTDQAPRIGAPAVGQCARLKTSFGCATHVDGGKIVGRVCAD